MVNSTGSYDVRPGQCPTRLLVFLREETPETEINGSSYAGGI